MDITNKFKHEGLVILGAGGFAAGLEGVDALTPDSPDMEMFSAASSGASIATVSESSTMGLAAIDPTLLIIGGAGTLLTAKYLINRLYNNLPETSPHI